MVLESILLVGLMLRLAVSIRDTDGFFPLINGMYVCLCVTVKLGGMLAYTPLDEKSIQLLLGHLHDFLKYVSCPHIIM